MSCGLWCVVCLVCIGLCHRGFLICLQPGRVVSASTKTLHFGGLRHTASCGVFGGNGILEALRVANGLFLKLLLLFIYLFLFLFFLYFTGLADFDFGLVLYV